MIVVVAATEHEADAVGERLVDLGGREIETLAVSEDRRLVRATATDEGEAWEIAAALRASGLVAVARPARGRALDAWRRDTEPVGWAGRITICHACSEHDRVGLPGLVELGAGGFGTGRHPTTGLLVEQLLGRITGGERVLDVGCGSGVLGLCALRLGAGWIVAVDIDPAAVEATRRNAALNGMADRVATTAEPLAGVDGTFDIVLANIGRAGIVDVAADIVTRLAPGGWLALSGFPPSQCSLIAGLLGPLVEIEQCVDGDWAALVMAQTSTIPGLSIN